MKCNVKLDPWKIILDHYDEHEVEIAESLLSIGNGCLGQRANFEESYSGRTLRGSYIAGVYYPDKTRVGWWKNGYPEYFAKVLNSTNWIGINVTIDDETLDLAKCTILNYYHELDMKNGVLTRNVTCKLQNNKEIELKAVRFISMDEKALGAVRYSIKPLNFDGTITFESYLDGNVVNSDSNYDEIFWNRIDEKSYENEGYVMMETKKLPFMVCSYLTSVLTVNGEKISCKPEVVERDKFVSDVYSVDVKKGEVAQIEKFVATTSNRYYENSDLVEKTKGISNTACETGFDALLEAHSNVWAKTWNTCDIKIDGDVAAQQGIRFNIFQLMQTYTGEDSRLNIGPKGFTGEKYGGSTYWDTEAYCIPFYMSTCDSEVARNLLVYRHNQLDRAIENAEKLGFTNGAALYPMVTMNGEECHNEWEITFEEIHRNGAIAYAVDFYERYTGDFDYVVEKGIDVIVGISRFWAQRVNFSKAKNKYVMLGVTGPNEYENNVNNNWYTNKMATWTLKYTLRCLNKIKEEYADNYSTVMERLNLKEDEFDKWNDIIDNMYFPYDEELGVFLQQDNFLDKEILPVKDLEKSNLPLNQNWSWDRILRSCYIKQADVLQGIYFFEDEYDMETIEKNFNFYEPITVHESSLSPCVHNILAAKINNPDKAYEMYLRTSRLDLDNYNNDSEDGCHITSMAGTWLSIVQGFAGMRVRHEHIEFNPTLPENWNGYNFKILYKGNNLLVSVTKEGTEISVLEGNDTIDVVLNGKSFKLANSNPIKIN
ncbi:family 65 glycosyl hydrolase domain-containing protein [Oceanirhabdus sp. W0125-5]|uniref:family 65 glycosyl hydrolase domain-containing protein n=1 Tax=Oceanirhabdus sp. W0125-5 TaxID=2999116 RepID=UPI0022F31DBF|nr:family 65 glycosyl hydrolase domain-containing protein [Oceanirhabdus sp. W0125-5]WBW95718.1 family 65 glycosyl hydrolase domain-containing protein [Oceanirhabdus sp. W0125-5]